MAAVAISPALGQEKQLRAARVTRTFSATAEDPAYNTRNFLLSPQVICDKDGSIRLAHSDLLTDETGATDFRQVEVLQGKVQAKKVILRDCAKADGAEVLFYGSAKEVLLNGKPVPPPEPVASSGWSRVKLKPSLFKSGSRENYIVFKEGSLLIEPGRRSFGTSYRSTDGGRSWSSEGLGAKNAQTGEYLIRLRLTRYAISGWAQSPVFDLWAQPTASVTTPCKLVTIHKPGERAGVARDTALTLFTSIRTGPTPSPEDGSWTGWHNLIIEDYHPGPAAEQHRWAQLRFDLFSFYGDRTPILANKFQLSFQLVPDPLPAGKVAAVSLPKDSMDEPLRGSTPFDYQAPSPRLKLLRQRYKLDQVIAPGKTEMQQLMLLRYWIRNQWHTAWGSHPAAWMPPWDSLIILESRDQPDCLTMCTHYACVFTQCCLALGWDARHCILDHHCVSEVYVRQHDKWVMMDTGNSAERADVGLHFERGGVPLSARELHLAQRGGNMAGITVHFTPASLAAKIATLCRPAPKAPAAPRPDVIGLAELKKYPVCQLDNYRRYAFPPRNNFLTTLVPGELEQGWSNYFYDGYWWVGDSPDNPTISPEYSRHLDPARPQDIDWKLGWTRIHLCRTAKPGAVQVDLETHTPNLARFERLAADGKGQPTPARFVWQLQPGRNELAVRSVNHWDKPGRPARVVLDWEPAAK
jgi:hypothetical protein